MSVDFTFSDIVHSANDIVIVTKVENDDNYPGKIVYVNAAFTEITEYPPEQAIGKIPKLFELLGSDDDTKRKVHQCLKDRVPVRKTIQSQTKSGDIIWLDMSIVPIQDSNGEYNHFATIERDITKERKLLLELEELSSKDHLTGLYNRRTMDNVIEKEFSRFKRGGQSFSYILLDLDYFKAINDKHGHPIGDKVLQLVGKVIQEGKRECDMSARIGGEEISIILFDTGLKQARQFAERLRKKISELSFSDGGEKINISASFGVTEINENDKSIKDLYKRVDEALYKAKAAGRNCIKITKS